MEFYCYLISDLSPISPDVIGDWSTAIVRHTDDLNATIPIRLLFSSKTVSAYFFFFLFFLNVGVSQ